MMWCLPGFFPVEVTFLCLCSVLWQWVTSLVSTQWGRNNKVCLIREATSTDILWNASIRKICLVSPFMIPSFTSMGLYFFYIRIFGYNPILCYIFCGSNCSSLATGSSFRLAPMALWHALSSFSFLLQYLSFLCNIWFSSPPNPLTLL